MAHERASQLTHTFYHDSIPDEVLLTPEPELAHIFAKHGIPKLRVPTRKTMPMFRKGFAQANARFNDSPFARTALHLDPNTSAEDPSSRPWTESDHQIPVRDGSTITARIYRPKQHPSSPMPPTQAPQSHLPVIVIFHSGGWFMGDLTTEAFLARLFCTRLSTLVINIAFRNYPDVPFGVPTTDCHDAIRWTAANIHHHGGDCTRGFILAGSSGGCTYGTICAHLARDEGLTPSITGQWLTCPVLPDTIVDDPTTNTVKGLFDHSKENRSIEQNRDAPLMGRGMQDAIVNLATFDWKSQLFSPFVFEKHDRLGVGGVYVQVTGMDPWRDSGRIYQGLCGRDGNRMRMDVYPGLPHCWWTSYSGLKVTRKWVEDSVEGMRWALQQEGSGIELASKL